MAVYKNKASQKVAVFAVDATGAAKTGDAANISAQISLDGGATAATNDAAPTELDATDAPGIYLFDLTQAETNADLIVLAPVSGTSGVVLRPVVIYTEPEQRSVDVTAISGDSTAADNLEAASDGTGYNLGGGSVVAASVTGNVGGNVTGTVAGVTPAAVGAAMTLTSAYDAAKTAAPASTALSSAVWTPTKAGYLDTNIGSRSFFEAGDEVTLTSGERQAVAFAVWAATTRTLSSFGTLVADIWAAVARTLTDKTGFSLTTAPPTAVEVRQEMDSNSTQLATIVTAVDKLDDTVEDNAGTYRFTAAALANTPASEVDLSPEDIAAIAAGISLDPQDTRDALLLAPSGEAAAGSIDDLIAGVKLKTDTLGAASVTVTSPVAASGDATIYAGQTHTGSLALSWAIADYAGPALAGNTANLRLQSRARTGRAALVEFAAIVIQDGTDVTITVSLTDEQTTTLSLGTYLAQIVAAVGGDVVVLIECTLDVNKVLTAPAT